MAFNGNPRFRLVLASAVRAAAIVAGSALSLGAATSALAQSRIKAVEPFYAVVSAERASVRAGNHDSFYVVADAPRDTLVLVDGEDATWSRVAYADGWPAFAKAAEGTYDAASQTFTLSKPSTLLAFSVINPQFCWQSLLPDSKPAPAGTKLKVLGEIKSGDQVIGYKVAAPEGARGYIESRSLRRATKAEIDAAKPKPVTPPPATPAPAATPAPTPAPNTPAPDRSLVDPQVPTPTATPAATPTAAPGTPAAQPATDPNAPKPEVIPQTVPNPAGTTPPSPGQTDTPPAPTTTPTTTTTEPAKPAVPTPAQRKAATLEGIEKSFKAMNSSQTDMFAAEYDQLLAEINKAIGELGNTAGDQARRRQLQLRADILKLRIDLRDSLRKNEEIKRGLNQDIVKASQAVAEAQKNRVYTLVGTLQASSVYDGTDLPLMYRVVSAGTESTTTLGYIRPEPTLKLETMVGRLVGVVGEASLDPTLKLNIVRPVRVDVVGEAGSDALPTLNPTVLPRPTPAPEATPALPNPATRQPTPTPGAPKDIIK